LNAGRGATDVADVECGISRWRKLAEKPCRQAIGPRVENEIAELWSLDGKKPRARAAQPQPLVGEEREGLIADNRSAHGGAELVPLQFGQAAGAGLECVGRIQVVIAKEPEQRAVRIVRAPARDDADHRAAGAPVLRREIVRDDTELIDRVRTQRQRVSASLT